MTEAYEPSVSVLLPTLNDGWKLGSQLAAIIPQLREQDELVLLLDGSDSLTRRVADEFDHPGLVRISNSKPSGVCKAVNQCYGESQGDWVIGASGNDEWQPGAIQAFADAVKNFPEAGLICGSVSTVFRAYWHEKAAFVDPSNLIRVWAHDNWKQGGSAAFILSCLWGEGYRENLEWLADYWQVLTLACRYGYVDMPFDITRVNFAGGGISDNDGKQDRYNEYVAVAKALSETEEYADINVLLTMANEIIDLFAKKPATMFERKRMYMS